MNENSQSIFSVKFQKISAELEINDDFLRCVTGDTLHFEISTNDLRTYVQSRPNTILFNFYQNNQLFQASITSKHCNNIIKSLEYLSSKIIS